MSGFSTTARNTMLDALTVDRVQLHNGDPGSDGDGNVIPGTLATAAFSAASGAARALSPSVAWTGLTPSQAVTYVSIWEWNGGSPVFLGSGATSGDRAANANGVYELQATTTQVAID